MESNVAGTYHLHTGEKTEGEKVTVVAEHNEVVHRTTSGAVYVTRNGRELVPTPSSDPNDPLNWPQAWKILVLVCVCCSGLMVAFCAAGIIPGFSQIVGGSSLLTIADTSLTLTCQAQDYDTSINRVSYLVSVNVLWLALGPIIWSALCDTYGRRPVYLAAMLITFVSSIACAVAKTYGVQVFTRMLQGFGASGAVAVGAGSIADVFFLHERGLYNGIWIAITQSGPFIAPMITGVVIRKQF